MMNMDLICAIKAQELVTKIKNNRQYDQKKAETFFKHAVGVLEEDGLIAFSLYLKAMTKGIEQALAEAIASSSADLLKENGKKGIGLNLTETDLLEITKKISSDLDTIFLSKRLIERMIVYVLYHLKALPDSKRTSSGVSDITAQPSKPTGDK